MALLDKEQQNELILLGIKLVGSVVIAVAVSKTRQYLKQR